MAFRFSAAAGFCDGRVADRVKQVIAAAGLPVETHYARILSAGQELLGVINDVIDFSALEMGGLSVRRQPLNLADTVAQAVQKVEPSAAAKGLSFQVTWALSASLVVLGDARRVEQVLVQLLWLMVR
jgi:signal transduction histidine kinase